MITALTVADFLRRAALTYGDRIGIVDLTSRQGRSNLIYGRVAARWPSHAAAPAPRHRARRTGRHRLP
jgi:hypothetical protein